MVEVHYGYGLSTPIETVYNFLNSGGLCTLGKYHAKVEAVEPSQMKVTYRMMQRLATLDGPPFWIYCTLLLVPEGCEFKLDMVPVRKTYLCFTMPAVLNSINESLDRFGIVYFRDERGVVTRNTPVADPAGQPVPSVAVAHQPPTVPPIDSQTPRFCGFCGSVTQPDQIFCVNCGRQIRP